MAKIDDLEKKFQKALDAFCRNSRNKYTAMTDVEALLSDLLTYHLAAEGVLSLQLTKGEFSRYLNDVFRELKTIAIEYYDDFKSNSEDD